MVKDQQTSLPWPTTKKRVKRPSIPWASAQPKHGPKQPTQQTLEANQQRQEQGQAAEQHALVFLEAQGLLAITRNYRCRMGEIDLIMGCGNTAVIVEVRQRSANTHGTALDSITHAKQQRVSRAAKHWWITLGQHQFDHLRFDVVALQNESAPEWIKNAWQLCMG
jgi:putative endonuclease